MVKARPIDPLSFLHSRSRGDGKVTIKRMTSGGLAIIVTLLAIGHLAFYFKCILYNYVNV